MANILIVDDEPDTVTLLERILEIEGYDIIKAYSGKDALDRLAELDVDLVILDIMMPGMDGYEVCRRIKTSMKTAHIPVIFLSVRSSEIDIIKGLKYRAEDYITKPFNKQILTAKIKAILRRTIKGEVEKISEKIEEKSEKTGSLDIVMFKSSKDFYRIIEEYLDKGKTVVFAASLPKILDIILDIIPVQEYAKKMKLFSMTFNENEELMKKNIGNTEIIEVPNLDDLVYLFGNLKEETVFVSLDEINAILGFSDTVISILRLSEKAVFSGIDLIFCIREDSITPEQRTILDSLFKPSNQKTLVLK
ncbi:transcriptional regulatory protein AfsQ1 [archaeon BMS3Bbin15]|nr:transcriptional regulatory protein AfsQ1 [archaeon BMS3Bbin15]